MTDSAGSSNSFDGISLPPRPLPPPGMPIAMPPLVEIAQESPAPKKGRGRVIAAVAALALIGGGIAVFATRSSDDGDGGSTAKYSLQAATQQAEDATNVAFEMKMTLGDVTAIDATGSMDTDEGLMSMNMTMPALEGARVDAIFDLTNRRMYLGADAFRAQGLDTDANWILFDVSSMPGMEEMFDQSTKSNPLDYAQAFDLAESVEDLGVENFGGEEVKHYRLTINTADVLAATPSLADQIEQLGDDFPEQVVYEVWVTANSQLRRIMFDMPIAGQTFAADITYTAVGEIEPIVVPADDEVTDLSELMSG